MNLASLALGKASLFTLVASRIVGFVVASPFPGRNVSTTLRIGLVVVLAWVASAFAPDQAVPRGLGLELLERVGAEVACGLVIGLAFQLVFAAAEILGGVLGQATGLGTPSVLNPTMDATETALARVVELGALLIALGLGAHRVALAGLLDSFRALPVGSPMAQGAALAGCVELSIDAFVVGVRLGTPVVAIALVVQVGLAMISRAAPSLQIFSVGFAVLFASTMGTLLASLDDVGDALASHFGSLPAVIQASIAALQS